MMNTNSCPQLLCFCLLLLSAIESNCEYQCSHHGEEKIARVHLRKTEHSAVKRSLTDAVFNQTFRVYAHYDSTFSSGLSSGVQSRIRDIVKNVTDFLQETLSVRQTPSPILLDRDCSNGRFFVTSGDVRPCVEQCQTTTTCGTAVVPQEHLLRCSQCQGSFSTCTESGTDGAGVSNVDYVLYISAVSTGSCTNGGSTIAFAGACQMEDEYDRPIAGFINFCSGGITSGSSDLFIFSVAKHEVLHALGFSNGLFPWFRDENGNPRTPRNSNGFPPQASGGGYMASNNTVRVVTYSDWWTKDGVVSKTVTLLVTPKVVETGRIHFNCSTLEGVQLEDQGGSGTALSHWESRILENEAMTGIISSFPVFSNFTLALLEDSGWYKADYSKAGQLVWGRGDGCSYTAGSCGGYIQSQLSQNKPIAPFCNRLNGQTSRYSCNHDRSAISFCNLAQFSSSLPNEYRYFNSGANFVNSVLANFLGGSRTIADYCPFNTAFSNTHCANASHIMGTGLNNPRAETYGEGSRCVEHNTSWVASGGSSTVTLPFTQAGCYQYQCSNGAVTIFILGRSYHCSQAGEVLTVNQVNNSVTYTGTIICPSCLEICYDDFENCPEAAALYQVGASTISSSSTTSSSSSTSTGVTNMTSSVGASTTSSVGASTTSSSSTASSSSSTSTGVSIMTSSSDSSSSSTSSSASTINATPGPSATNTVSSSRSQSNIVNATPSSTSSVSSSSSSSSSSSRSSSISTTAPSTSPASSGFGLIPFLSLTLFGILTATLMK